MHLDDIDTPVSEAELSGIDDVAEVGKSPEVKLEGEDPAAALAADKEPPDVVEETPPAVEPKQERESYIPRARFDELNAKHHAEREAREALERRLAELEANTKAVEKPEPLAVDVDSLEQKYFDLMMEGNREEAVKIRSQINAEIQSRAEAVADAKANQRVQEEVRKVSEQEAEREMIGVASKAVIEYPFLDPNSPDVNPEAISEVVEWREFYASKGDPIHVALAKAVNRVAPSYAEANPAIQAEPMTDKRKDAAIKRNAADAMAQPPVQSAGVGNRAAPPAPKVETQKDWEKLSESEREQILMGG